ncbi:hypothetical protein [Neisseria canis]|uniref:hypothetical protein n=1 Tax=Neisseria canis TaxID=493 RepID=UPI000A191776|nr:hypothetical protein [Neisseria canis]OSI09164.1 hypothetical protein BWD07_11845 [Neisseria canis]
MTRRGYEKARKGLLELGVLQYRRSGVHGKMHWLLNREKLLEKCYQARGLKLPKGFSSQFIIDRDNFRLDNWVPLDLWHAFLDMRIDTGNKVSIKGKKTLLKQLQIIHNKGLDINGKCDRLRLLRFSLIGFKQIRTLFRNKSKTGRRKAAARV